MAILRSYTTIMSTFPFLTRVIKFITRVIRFITSVFIEFSIIFRASNCKLVRVHTVAFFLFFLLQVYCKGAGNVNAKPCSYLVPLIYFLSFAAICICIHPHTSYFICVCVCVSLCTKDVSLSAALCTPSAFSFSFSYFKLTYYLGFNHCCSSW